ncbi:MAG TPA: Gmad2 immunoglobulin-like domain-containing protein [Cellulomonadaceae bacterium]|nr:Gmad2 immunoglobulin-like domain-containing protein [Cellulomonadaceae bacterium]
MGTIGSRRRGRVAAVPLVALLTAAALTSCAAGAGNGTPAASMTTSPTPTQTATQTTTQTTTATPAATTTSPATPLPSDQPSAGSNVITTPTPGSTVSGPDVTVAGSGSAFEGTLNWEIVPVGSTTPVASGFTSAGANGTPGPFTFSATVPTGTMTVAVWEPDMSSGEAGTARRNLVTVTFTVS